MGNVGVVREQDGVVGHHWVAGGQNASYHMAYTVQDAVVHQEVVNQQLNTHKRTKRLEFKSRVLNKTAHSR